MRLKSFMRPIAGPSFSLVFLLAAIAHPALAQSADDASPDSKTAVSKLSVSPKSLSYNVDIDKGEFTETKHFNIKNNGSLALQVIVNPPSNPDYVITSGGAKTTIPGKAKGSENSLTVDVEFIPHGPGKNVDGSIDITSNATSGENSATVNLKGSATQKKPTPTATPTPTVTATLTATPTATPTPGPGHFPLARVGLWTQFDERGYPNGYWQGQLLQTFTEVDPVVGTTVEAEASLQLDTMKALGVNTITYELRTADPSCKAEDGCTTTFPTCLIDYALGLDWPQPTTTELTNLGGFFDLVASKGMKVDLLLTTTHMEESGDANSQAWLGSIFDTVAGHPALDLILLGGDRHLGDSTGDGTLDECGSQGGEPPLWLGPSSYAATYLNWAIPFAALHGIASNQISAEAIVGSFLLDSGAAAGVEATDQHLWDPLMVLKSIFDGLAISSAQRKYALSFWEHRKCIDAQSYQTCTDLDPHDWANQTLQKAISTVGSAQTSQLLMTEGGTEDPANWPAQFSFESIGYLMQEYQLLGGNVWRWCAFQDSEEANPTTEGGGQAVKKRGVDFTYFPPKNEIVDLGGFHLSWIPNGSFELGGAGNVPTDWTVTGSGTGVDYFLAGEPNEPQVPSRGQYDLRLTTGTNATSSVTATSEYIQATPSTAYTTTGNLRFAWTGDPNPSRTPATRPQVFVAFNYFQSPGVPSAVKAQDIFPFYQENSTTDFQTFPLQYTTPSDATSLQIVIGAARNNLPTPIVFDADNLR